MGGARLSGGYRLQVDLADFLDGDRTDTRNGVLVSRRVVTTREYTNAQSHEIFVRGSHTHDLSRNWQVRLIGDASPAAIHRLAIQLPDKYPGQTLVYRAVNLVTSGRAEVARTGTGWPIAVHVRVGREWQYRSSQRAGRSVASLGITAGRAW